MKRLRLLGFILWCCFTTPLLADTINFDDIDASAGDMILTSYQNYSWTNFSAYTTVPGFPGFSNGIVSGPNAAYSSDVGKISSMMPFDFTGGYLGSGYYDNMNVTVQGLFGGTQYFSQTVTVNTETPQLFNFAFKGIDTLIFSTSTTPSTTDPYYCGAVGCSYFTLDDAVLTLDVMPPPPPPPSTAATSEPSSLILLALGLFAMLPAWRTRFSHR